MGMDDNPMRKVTKGKESHGRVRFLSDDERAHLLKGLQRIKIIPIFILSPCGKAGCFSEN